MLIDRLCFLVTYNPYNAARYFTASFAEAWRRRGVEVLIIDPPTPRLDEELLRQIILWRPTLTCSFSTIAPVQGDRFFWDITQIPHWAITLDPSPYFAALAQSPYAIISCVDQRDCAFFAQQGAERCFFFPHAVPREIALPHKEGTRSYDIALIGSCYDYEGLRSFWKEELPQIEQQILDFAIAQSEASPQLALLDLLIASLEHYQRSKADVDFKKLFFYLDRYLRGRARVSLIRSIRHHPLHLFGQLFQEHSSSSKRWEDYLSGQENVVFHPSLPIRQMASILRQTKICLNSMPFFKNGSHERLLETMASGALAVTSDSIWVRQNFSVGKELLIYEEPLTGELDAILGRYLSDEKLRSEMAHCARNSVAQSHTWDSRVIAAEEQLSQWLDV